MSCENLYAGSPHDKTARRIADYTACQARQLKQQAILLPVFNWSGSGGSGTSNKTASPAFVSALPLRMFQIFIPVCQRGCLRVENGFIKIWSTVPQNWMLRCYLLQCSLLYPLLLGTNLQCLTNAGNRNCWYVICILTDIYIWSMYYFQIHIYWVNVKM